MIDQLPGGGTLAVQLALDALRRGMEATITTFNLQLFDPTWFVPQGEPCFGEFLTEKLQQQLERKGNQTSLAWDRMALSTQAYIEYLSLGGRVQMQPLEETLIIGPLSRGTPILCGLSATYLYQEARELIETEGQLESVSDDTGGYPVGHFVVIHGFDSCSSEVEIADPLHENPFSDSNQYRAAFSKLATAISLGIVTYDANILVIAPQGHMS